jgi:hypothetical protein
VPVNFAFSFVFGLLAGNANVVRVPSRPHPQTGILCDALRAVLAEERFAELRAMTTFVRYGHDDAITAAYSAASQARIIWGGDVTIQQVRRFPLPERGVDIAFADRTSFCLVDAPAVLALDDAGLERLAGHFYNDAYVMDQNACSSPHLVLWHGAAAAAARTRFWDAVGRVAEAKYGLSAMQAVDKLTHLCRDAVDQAEVSGLARWKNHVYRVELERLPASVDALRGQYGYFYEHEVADLEEVAPIVSSRHQTLTYFGVDPQRLLDIVVSHRLTGIDRIVPIGRALDIGVIWDGYDIIASLSRIIHVV